MSKKLLMNNHSENGLMPVMDGLIGWYDARDKNADNTYLIDKSGNGNNISCNSNNCVFYDDYIDVVGESYSDTLNYSSYINAEFTISYCIDTTKSISAGVAWWRSQLKCMSGLYVDSLGWWIRPNNRSANVWYRNRKHINDNDNKMIFPKEKIMVTVTMSSMQVALYVNGVLYISVLSKPLNMNNLSLGLFGESRYPNGMTYKYYSSYIYNRALTEDEIQQNYQYEQSIERGGNGVR